MMDNLTLVAFETYSKAMFADMSTDAKLKEAMEYSYFSGGKRIRPLFVFATARMKNIDAELLFPLAFAIELVHTYSLIHDDLPAMDDDALRRGMPTNHIVFGEDVAILAGDALLSESFYQLLQLSFAPELIMQVGKSFSKAIGVDGMVKGQVLDMRLEANDLTIRSIEDLAVIHRLKTGKLFNLAMLETSKLIGFTETEYEILASFSDLIGRMFQAIDDYLDDELDTGKTPGSDMKNMKPTYLSILGKENLKLLLFEWKKDALALLEQLAETNCEIGEMQAIVALMFQNI